MSKYASLPDIDTAPDVYETPDEPTSQSTGQDDDLDETGYSPSASGLITNGNGDIDQQGLNRLLAKKRFVGAPGINGDDADFSQSLLRRQTSNRYPLPRIALESSEYSLIPRGYSSSSRSAKTGAKSGEVEENETKLERLRRLRFEMQELEEQLEAEADATPGPAKPAGEQAEGANEGKKGKAKKVDPTPVQLLAELRHLQAEMGPLSTAVGEGTPAPGEGLMKPSAMRERQARAASLLQQLSTVRPASESISQPPPEGASTKRSANDDTLSAGSLDARLNTLETLLGSASLLSSSLPSSSSPSLPPPILHSLSKLDHQLSLLSQPRHLDSISRRVKVLVTDLERVHEARRKLGDARPLSVALASGITVVSPGTGATPAGGLSASVAGGPVTSIPGVVSVNPKSDASGVSLPPDALQKLDALSTLLPRIDPLLPLVPHLLSRLQSLSALHASSLGFSDSLASIRETVGRGERRYDGLEEVLVGVEASLKENEETVKGNLEVVEARVKGLLERLEKLEA